MRWSPAAGTDFGEGVVQLGLPVIVKNGFLDVEEEEEPMRKRRSSSVPRQLKLSSPKSGAGSPLSAPSAISTSASDGEGSEPGSAGEPQSPDRSSDLYQSTSAPQSPLNPPWALKRSPGLSAAATEFVPSPTSSCGLGSAHSTAAPATPVSAASPSPILSPQPMPPFPASPAAGFPSPPRAPEPAQRSGGPGTPHRMPASPGGPAATAPQSPLRGDAAVRLNPRAQVFQPFASPRGGSGPGTVSPPGSPIRRPASPPLQAEIKSVLHPVLQELNSHPKVKALSINEGCMGSTTQVHIEMHDDVAGNKSAGRYVMQSAKDGFLRAAERSACTYVLGYDRAPFHDEEDGSFKVTLSSVPRSMERMACWETYQTGLCSRTHCECCHPGKEDLAPVRLSFVKRQDAGPPLNRM